MLFDFRMHLLGFAFAESGSFGLEPKPGLTRPQSRSLASNSSR